MEKLPERVCPTNDKLLTASPYLNSVIPSSVHWDCLQCIFQTSTNYIVSIPRLFSLQDEFLLCAYTQQFTASTPLRVMAQCTHRNQPESPTSQGQEGHVSEFQVAAELILQTLYLPFCSAPELSTDKAENYLQSCLPGLLAERWQQVPRRYSCHSMATCHWVFR